MWLVLGVALACMLVASTVRVVPAGTALVVSRLGQVHRITAAGVGVVLPMLERATTVPLRLMRTEPLPTSAMTRDGVTVRLHATLQWRTAAPGRAVAATPDAATATVDALDRALHHLVAGQDLSDLLRDREPLIRGLTTDLNAVTDHWGVEVLDVDLLDIEVRAGPELLRLMR